MGIPLSSTDMGLLAIGPVHERPSNSAGYMVQNTWKLLRLPLPKVGLADVTKAPAPARRKPDIRASAPEPHIPQLSPEAHDQFGGVLVDPVCMSPAGAMRCERYNCKSQLQES